jgi:bifunctional DNase/RNase/MFS family permease
VSILAHRAFVRATVTNFFFFASLNGFVLLPLYIEQLGGTPAEIGIVMGLYSAVGIVVQPLLGPWIDALGRRPFMRLGVALVLASAVLALGTGSTGWLALVRILQGIGFSAFFVANFSHVVDLVPAPERGRALGLYGVSGLLSTALAPLLGEWVVRRFGFRAWFVACAGLAGVAGALVWPIRARARSTAVEPRVGAWMRAGLVELFRRPMAVTLVFGLGAGALFAFLPTFAEQLGVRTLALFYTAYAGAAMAVRVAAGRLIDTHGRRAVIVPSMFVQAGAGPPSRPAGAGRARAGRAPGGRRARLSLSRTGRAGHGRCPGQPARGRDRGVQRGLFGRQRRRCRGVRRGRVVDGVRADVGGARGAPAGGGRGQPPAARRRPGLRGHGAFSRWAPGGAFILGRAGHGAGRGVVSMTWARAGWLAVLALLLTGVSTPGGSRVGAAAPAGPEEVQVVAVYLDPVAHAPKMVLERKRDQRRLEMVIGLAEMNGIAIPLNRITPPRPLTHDLFLTLFGRLQVTVKQAVITDLRDDIYYATLHLSTATGELTLDARPSDAIALAIRARAPVLVEARVFEKSGLPPAPRRPSI